MVISNHSNINHILPNFLEISPMEFSRLVKHDKTKTSERRASDISIVVPPHLHLSVVMIVTSLPDRITHCTM